MVSPIDITLKVGDALGGFSSEARRLAEPDNQTLELLLRVREEPQPLGELEEQFQPALGVAIQRKLIEVESSSEHASLTSLGSYVLASMLASDGSLNGKPRTGRRRKRRAAASAAG